MSSNFSSSLERAILETLAYSDVFDYPLTLDELHRKKADVAVLADFEDRDDVGVMQASRGTRFATEPFEQQRILGRLQRQNLERDPAAQRDLFRFENHAHAA
ncbi:MAG TPA: hypothetical protein PKJ84_05750, partial [Anaerolineales bacterium]|nr:hypothetical protein [Anaerolineales bacterium]